MKVRSCIACCGSPHTGPSVKKALFKKTTAATVVASDSGDGEEDEEVMQDSSGEDAGSTTEEEGESTCATTDDEDSEEDATDTDGEDDDEDESSGEDEDPSDAMQEGSDDEDTSCGHRNKAAERSDVEEDGGEKRATSPEVRPSQKTPFQWWTPTPSPLLRQYEEERAALDKCWRELGYPARCRGPMQVHSYNYHIAWAIATWRQGCVHKHHCPGVVTLLRRPLTARAVTASTACTLRNWTHPTLAWTWSECRHATCCHAVFGEPACAASEFSATRASPPPPSLSPFIFRSQRPPPPQGGHPV